MPWKTTLRPVVDVLVIQESVVVSVLSIHVVTSSVEDPQSRQTMLLYWYPDFIFLQQNCVVFDDDMVCCGRRCCKESVSVPVLLIPVVTLSVSGWQHRRGVLL